MAEIIVPDYGVNNTDLYAAQKRLEEQGTWKDLSTVVITPASNTVPVKVATTWLNLMTPPNQKRAWITTRNCEVGEAYSETIAWLISETSPFKDWRYVLCVEHDNVPPPDGLVKLAAQLDRHPELSAIGGLYWTKGPGGVPQIWGDPKAPDLNFRPIPPDPNGGLVECCGTGMGFTLFRMSMFKDPKLRKPWFKTQCEMTTEGAKMYTQDLYFWEDARRNGHRCAIDCSTLVGHYSLEDDRTW